MHLAVYTWLVYNQLGVSAFAGTAFVLLRVPLQVLTAKLYSYIRFVFKASILMHITIICCNNNFCFLRNGLLKYYFYSEKYCT